MYNFQWFSWKKHILHNAYRFFSKLNRIVLVLFLLRYIVRNV